MNSMEKYYINGKFLTYRQTGVQRYAREIVSAIDEMCKPEQFEMVLPKVDLNIPKYKKIKVVQVGPFKGIPWEQITFPLYVLKKCGISVNLCNVAPLLSPGYSTIHDLKVLSHPQFFGWKFRWWYRLLFANQTRRCKTIFTVSEQVMKDLINYYPFLSSDKIVVSPDAWQHFERVNYDEQALVKYCLEQGKYYFAMGSLEPNKNFRWIAEVAKRNSNHMFVVAGTLNSKVFSDGLGFDCPDNMKLLGYVTDEEAKSLMQNAKAFLFPSFCEGFGMPPLEALSAGTPRIIVSDIPVMHEIFNDNAIYINPNQYNYDLEQMLAGSYCDADSVLNKFSWENSAEKLLLTLRKE